MKTDGRFMKRMLLYVIIAAVGTCAWCENIPDAVIVTQQAASQEFSYLLEGYGVAFAIDGDDVGVTVNGEDASGFTLSETAGIDIYLAHTFTLTANQDPDSTDNYYATFFTGECAYKLPDDGSVKAYIGTVGKYKDAVVLNLTQTDTIHASEAVILRARPGNTVENQTEITLMPSCNRRAASTDNMLTGSDVAVEALGENDYALALGQDGVGFYNCSGSPLGANMAYLRLSGSQPAPVSSFVLRFDDGSTTGIPATASDCSHDDAIYNLRGQRVDGSYKGLMIKNGQVMYNRQSGMGY